MLDVKRLYKGVIERAELFRSQLRFHDSVLAVEDHIAVNISKIACVYFKIDSVLKLRCGCPPKIDCLLDLSDVDEFVHNGLKKIGHMWPFSWARVAP